METDRPMRVRDYVRDELAASTSGTSVELIAQRWLKRVPKAQMPAIQLELAMQAVRNLNMRHGEHKPMVMQSPVSSCPTPSTSAPTPGVGKSKWERYAPHLRMLDRTQLLDGKAYRLGDLGADLLRRVADVRRAQAHTMLGNAEWFEKVASACDEHGVTKMADLPDDVLLALHTEANS